jgi:zinc transporter ZupT
VNGGALAAVFAAGLVAALATGLGALPLLVVRRRSVSLLGGANALAGGIMLSVALVFVLEGARDSAPHAFVGVALGAALVAAARRIVPERALERGWLQGPGSRRALLVVAVMAAHSLAEGIALGSSFGTGAGRGVITTTALALHKIAEGLAICLVLVPRGVRLRTAAGWSVVTALPEPLVAVPTYAAVATATSALPLMLGFAAGAMALVVATELLPEALASARRAVVAAQAGAALVLTTVLQLALL